MHLKKKSVTVTKVLVIVIINNMLWGLKMDLKIKKMEKEHWNRVAQIYYQGIITNKATFQNTVPSYDEWNHGHIDVCRLVAILNDKVVGWSALSKVSSRCVYAGVAEVSIYVDEKYRGKGIGNKLLGELVKLSEKNGFWTLQSGIIEENFNSINLHKKCGFRILGIREKVAKMSNGIWHDVILMERRSNLIGID